MKEDAPGLPDLLAPGLSVVFCGLNPGLSSALEQRHFLNPSNRFWRTLHLAGFTSEQLSPLEDNRVLEFGCGLTTVVPRATTSAQAVKAHEYRDAAQALEDKIAHWQPAYIAFLGKPAYAAISGQREIHWGLQAQRFAEAKVWVLPNPSGLNRSFNLDRLVEAYTELRLATL
ncbi:TDG/mug DNA glycosylase family protein [Pseudomonas sp. JUb42]|jgi:TDG/mug DNA glycosylase family protein|uniref:G/U mismatch-specific DNA glycosylase n=1 Tax=Pseudomonas sp. JUb42 TaxID=2940611 RepID=UPI002169D583|nr:G/U mismatch-specific DNA glycosylase [Pseudomonas sp. JUb42]MCS3470138.1 TDG/mug DNA glycosylase family protein [Pseudomonas sp. JUb42]